jgi:hypothetical protein
MKTPWPAKTTVTALVPDSAGEAARVFARCGFGRGPFTAPGTNAYVVDKDQPNPDRVVGAELRERGEGMRDARDSSRERERRASENKGERPPPEGKPVLLREWEQWEEWTWEGVKRGGSWI